MLCFSCVCIYWREARDIFARNRTSGGLEAEALGEQARHVPLPHNNPWTELATRLPTCCIEVPSNACKMTMVAHNDTPIRRMSAWLSLIRAVAYISV